MRTATISATAGGVTRSAVLTIQDRPIAGGTTVVAFEAAGATGAAFSSYTENGITVTGSSAAWRVGAFGSGRAVIFSSPAGGGTTVGELRVTSAGASFAFSSADFYSSTTRIPYEFEGRGTVRLCTG